MMNEADAQNNLSNGVTPSQPQDASDVGTADPPIMAAIALHNCLPWAGDFVAGIPEEADTASTSAAEAPTPSEGERIQASRHNAGERPALRLKVPIRECPLHTAMRHLAEATVAQHVLYLEGEVRSRPDLVNTISRWERMHTLIRECVCPVTRAVPVSAPALAEIVDITLSGMFTPGQEQLRTQFVHVLEVCAACATTAECPIGDSYSIE